MIMVKAKVNKISRQLLHYDSFKDYVKELLENTRNAFAIVSVNISNFKYINKVYGYSAGDRLLRQMEEFYVMQDEYCRAGCRLYSDRLVIITNVTGLSIDKIRRRLHNVNEEFQQKMKAEYPLAFIHINAGAYLIQEWDSSVSDMLDKAEMARKTIAGSYTRTISIYRETYKDAVNLESSIIPMYERALKEGRIEIFLQPKVDVRTKDVVGAEALVRMRDEAGNLIMPGTFIPVLEKTGLITGLDCYVLELVYQTLRRWMDDGYEPIRISANISRVDFFSDTITDKMEELMEEYRIPKEYIEIEITESSLTAEMGPIISKVRKMRSEGYITSMDDFGSGYSSLGTVSELPLDVIKFDRSFVQHSINNPMGIRVMGALMEAFEDSGIEVVCEGVEYGEEEELVSQCGCHVVQGYLYDKPIPVEEFEKKYIKKRQQG